MIVLGQALASGILLGCFYALIALGFALVFGVGRVFNLAHGELVVIGAYVGYWLWESSGLNPFLAMPIAMIVLASTGLLAQKILARIGEPFELNALVFTFGASLFLQSLMLNLWTGNYRLLAVHYLERSIGAGGISIGLGRLAVAALSLFFIGAIHFLITKTHLGKALRATSQDREAASLMGINVLGVDRLTFCMGAAMAGAAGPLFALLHYLSPTAGVEATVIALVLTILGGIGKIGGILVGGLILGLADSLTVGLIGSQWKELVTFSILLLLLRFRSAGLSAGRRYHEHRPTT